MALHLCDGLLQDRREFAGHDDARVDESGGAISQALFGSLAELAAHLGVGHALLPANIAQSVDLRSDDPEEAD